MFKTAAIALACCVAAAVAVADDLPPPRDPMQPFDRSVAAAAAAGPRFTLTAVLISSARRVAILNGKPYQHGERVDGAEIIGIDAAAVRLRENGTDIVVPLGRLAPRAASASQGETAP